MTPKVLIVEDDLDALELLENALVHFGYDVSQATDGNAALEMIRTGEYRLVVSDWEMPGMTGVELCREVRQRTSCGYTYFILLTSRSGTHSLIDGLKAGADEFLSKPFDPDELQHPRWHWPLPCRRAAAAQELYRQRSPSASQKRHHYCLIDWPDRLPIREI